MQRDRNLFRSAALAADASSRRSFIARGTAALAAVALPSAVWAAVDYSRFKRVPTQYIAALAAPGATSGDNAETWGLWRQDPGPRGLRLTAFDRLANGGAAPAGWHLDKNAWWLEEHGLLMESPEFPMPAGQYVVTGDRETTSVLTVHSASGGKQRWELADGATLHDVTHLRCRSALYTPAKPGASCTPAAARQQDFPVAPGAAMPPVADCAKQDYQVLIVIGVAKEA